MNRQQKGFEIRIPVRDQLENSIRDAGKPIEHHKERPRKTVSTSRIFDKKPAHLHRPGRRGAAKASERHDIDQGVHKPSSRSRRERHRSKQKYAQNKREKSHPLYQTLVDNDLEYRSRVRSEMDASIDAAHNALSDRLATTLIATQKTRSSQVDLKEELCRPLADEQLALTTTANGVTHIDRVHLGQRVQVFRAFSATKKQELDELWKEWATVQEQIVVLGIEVLGQEAFDIKGKSGVGKGKDLLPMGETKTLAVNQEVTLMEYKIAITQLEEEIKAIGDRALERLEASEKELNLMQKQKQSEILAIFC